MGGTRRANSYAMVQVVLRMVAAPRRRADLVGTLRSLMLPLQAASGFISSRVYLDADHPDALCYVEEWQTAEDLDRQIRSSHYTRLLALMEEAAEVPALRLNWVSEVRGLEYLEAVRLRTG